MDNRIWSRLVPEVLCLVVETCDRDTLLSWALTNHLFYEIASNLLWETLYITIPELLEFCPRLGPTKWIDGRGLFINPRSLRRDPITCKILEFLANNAFRQRPSRRSAGFPMIRNQQARLPGLRVKNLIMDFEYGGATAACALELAGAETVIAGISRMLRLLPSLRVLQLDGPIHSQHLAIISRMHHVQQLKLRSRLGWTQHIDTGHSGVGPDRPGLYLLLNLQYLARLPQLQSLHLYRLAPNEAKVLASVTIKLTELKTLSLNAGPPAREDDARHHVAGLPENESPIITFLGTVQAYQVAGGYGLPQSLKHLHLQDLYCPGRPKHSNLILNTVAPCSNLVSLGLNLWTFEALRKIFLRGYFPRLA
ncbi:MAG: hypothetical protein Q9218_007739 [Villophora microphyllina]